MVNKGSLINNQNNNKINLNERDQLLTTGFKFDVQREILKENRRNQTVNPRIMPNLTKIK